MKYQIKGFCSYPCRRYNISLFPQLQRSCSVCEMRQRTASLSLLFSASWLSVFLVGLGLVIGRVAAIRRSALESPRRSPECAAIATAAAQFAGDHLFAATESFSLFRRRGSTRQDFADRSAGFGDGQARLSRQEAPGRDAIALRREVGGPCRPQTTPPPLLRR